MYVALKCGMSFWFMCVMVKDGKESCLFLSLNRMLLEKEEKSWFVCLVDDMVVKFSPCCFFSKIHERERERGEGESMTMSEEDI